MPVAVNEGTFEQEVLQSEKPVIVDFWAEWCGPCHAIAPALDKIGEEHADRVKIAKVNIDEEQGLAAKYGIVSIPMLIMFENGEPAKSLLGARPKSAIEREFGLSAE
jgi:thioredoxin 1